MLNQKNKLYWNHAEDFHRLKALRMTELEDWFADERIKIWRDIRERQNATLDLEDGTRLHVKRYKPSTGEEVLDECSGVRFLEAAGIKSVPLVCWGVRDDGSGLLVTRDLVGFTPADRLVREGMSFTSLLKPTADVAARLHNGSLHHRDLYLCHFMYNEQEVALIDAARVRKLPWLTRRRWIVKDLAQFRFSGLEIGVNEDDLDDWLARWAHHLGTDTAKWRDDVCRKAERIAVHDAHLREKQPERRVSLQRTPNAPTVEDAHP